MLYRNTYGPLLLLALLVALVGGPIVVQAKDSASKSSPGNKSTGNFNIPSKTIGGKQFWADRVHFHKWRIQQHVLTDHCRLLNADNVRCAWGSFAECENALEKIKKDEKVPPMKGTAIILMHGIIRSRARMVPLAKFLDKHSSYTIINVEYPSTRLPIKQLARNLDNVIRELHGIEEIHFVAHSLGNLVIRRYLAGNLGEGTAAGPDPRIKRFVMLAPPNQGARMANWFADKEWFKLVYGTPGQELGPEWETIAKDLAIPSCQFAIIAGGRDSDNKAVKQGLGFNPLLAGDNDFVVRVKETRLAGARDFAVFPLSHAAIPKDNVVHKYTLRFLRHGYFRTDATRRPIARAK